MFRPRFHASVSRRQPGGFRHNAHLLLSGNAAVALDIPTLAEHRIVTADQLCRRLMRRMRGAECQPKQPGIVRPLGGMTGQEADRLIDEVGGQVIAIGEGSRRLDTRIVAHQFRSVLIGLRIHEAIKTIEAAAQRPAVERTGGTALDQWRDVPLAEHIVAIAVRTQHFRQRAGLFGDLAAVAWIAAVKIGEAADPDGMMIAPGQQSRARGRTHRCRVKPGVAQARGGQPIDGRGADRRTVAAEVGKAGVVEHDHQNVGRAGRRFRRCSARTASKSAIVVPIFIWFPPDAAGCPIYSSHDSVQSRIVMPVVTCLRAPTLPALSRSLPGSPAAPVPAAPRRRAAPRAGRP